jgi:hypothetical protein
MPRRRAYFKRLDEHPKKDRVEALLTAARAPESHVAVADARVGLDITSPGSNAMKFPLPEGIRVVVSAAVLMVTTGVMGPAKSRVAARKRRATTIVTRTRRDAVIGNLSALVWRGRPYPCRSEEACFRGNH